MIHTTYLPYSSEQLRGHFLADAESYIDYFVRSAARYTAFIEQNPITAGIPITTARGPRQIEKDERFWTVSTLKHVYEHPQRRTLLASLLADCFGKKPPLADFGTWNDCLDGELALYFEAQCPSPQSYTNWLAANVRNRHLIPYVFDAADRASARPLEGPTHVDGILVNATNGFGLLVEAKVLANSSCDVSFDCLRNQLTRNIDIMLEPYTELRPHLDKRIPDRSLFCILTPRLFRDYPQSRHYAGLLREYQTEYAALVRDLPHREKSLLQNVSKRLGWLTFEDIKSTFPDACPWLKAS